MTTGHDTFVRSTEAKCQAIFLIQTYDGTVGAFSSALTMNRVGQGPIMAGLPDESPATSALVDRNLCRDEKLIVQKQQTNSLLASCLIVVMGAALFAGCDDDADSNNLGDGGTQGDGGGGTQGDGGVNVGGGDALPSSMDTGNSMAIGPMSVGLKSASVYVILAKTGISATAGTSVVGNIGVSPAAESLITGFDQARAASNDFSTSAIVSGRIEASDMAVPTPSNLTTAISDMEAAFTDAAGRTLPNFTERGAGNISGLTLAPGLYKWSTGVLIASSVTLAGGANDTWIFQIAQDLTLSSGVEVTLAGGAKAKNIFWQVAGQTVLGTTSKMKGNILCQTKIVMETGSSLQGRALAQTAVTMDASTVTAP